MKPRNIPLYFIGNMSARNKKAGISRRDAGSAGGLKSENFHCVSTRHCVSARENLFFRIGAWRDTETVSKGFVSATSHRLVFYPCSFSPIPGLPGQGVFQQEIIPGFQKAGVGNLFQMIDLGGVKVFVFTL